MTPECLPLAPRAAALARRLVRRALNRGRNDNPTENGGVSLPFTGIGYGGRRRHHLGVAARHEISAKRVGYLVCQSRFQMTQAYAIDNAGDGAPNANAQIADP